MALFVNKAQECLLRAALDNEVVRVDAPEGKDPHNMAKVLYRRRNDLERALREIEIVNTGDYLVLRRRSEKKGRK